MNLNYYAGMEDAISNYQNILPGDYLSRILGAVPNYDEYGRASLIIFLDYIDNVDSRHKRVNALYCLDPKSRIGRLQQLFPTIISLQNEYNMRQGFFGKKKNLTLDFNITPEELAEIMNKFVGAEVVLNVSYNGRYRNLRIYK